MQKFLCKWRQWQKRNHKNLSKPRKNVLSWTCLCEPAAINSASSKTKLLACNTSTSQLLFYNIWNTLTHRMLPSMCWNYLADVGKASTSSCKKYSTWTISISFLDGLGPVLAVWVTKNRPAILLWKSIHKRSNTVLFPILLSMQFTVILLSAMCQ